jgi:hypothetical protein
MERGGGNASEPFPVVLPFESGRLGETFPLLQHGFTVRTRVGIPLGELLTDELGLAPEYVRDRITTIFLNGKPVDDLERSIVADGSLVALSAAMPGLVGATLRRGGYYAPFRESITDASPAAETVRGSGTVRIRLFNLLLRELGPSFLGRGVIVTGDDREWLSPELWEEIPYSARAFGHILLSFRFGDDQCD